MTVDTPKEICAAVRHHVKYTEDLEDEWQSGEKTWERGTGDCEDYARTVVDLCAKKGIEAEIFFVYPRGSWEAHAVVVGKWKGNLWFSSNGWYERVDSWDDIKRSVARDAGWRGMEMLVKSEADALKGETVLVPAKTTATSVVLP